MIEAESTLGSDAPPSAPAAPVADWSDVRGFQVVSQRRAAEAPAAHGGSRVLRRANSPRSSTCGRRGSPSPSTSSIVLSSDGVIRWLGDPIARLIGGDDILKPRSVLLADEALAPEGRQSVEARLSLWIAAHIRKVLGALEALAEPGEVGEPARELALRVVAGVRGARARSRARAGEKPRSERARRAAQARRPFRRLLHLCSRASEAGRARRCARSSGAFGAGRSPARSGCSPSPRRGARPFPPRRRWGPRPTASPDFASAATALCASISSSG